MVGYGQTWFHVGQWSWLMGLVIVHAGPWWWSMIVVNDGGPWCLMPDKFWLILPPAMLAEHARYESLRVTVRVAQQLPWKSGGSLVPGSSMVHSSCQHTSSGSWQPGTSESVLNSETMRNPGFSHKAADNSWAIQVLICCSCVALRLARQLRKRLKNHESWLISRTENQGSE